MVSNRNLLFQGCIFRCKMLVSRRVFFSGAEPFTKPKLIHPPTKKGMTISTLTLGFLGIYGTVNSGDRLRDFLVEIWEVGGGRFLGKYPIIYRLSVAPSQ